MTVHNRQNKFFGRIFHFLIFTCILSLSAFPIFAQEDSLESFLDYYNMMIQSHKAFHENIPKIEDDINTFNSRIKKLSPKYSKQKQQLQDMTDTLYDLFVNINDEYGYTMKLAKYCYDYVLEGTNPQAMLEEMQRLPALELTIQSFDISLCLICNNSITLYLTDGNLDKNDLINMKNDILKHKNIVDNMNFSNNRLYIENILKREKIISSILSQQEDMVDIFLNSASSDKKPANSNKYIDFSKSLDKILKQRQKPGQKLIASKFKFGEKSYTTADENYSFPKTADAAPLAKNGRTMLPVRYVSEALGLDVSWDENTGDIILNDNKLEIKIPSGSDEITVNGKSYKSDVRPFSKNGRVYLSISNISEAMGLKQNENVFWNQPTKEIIIIRDLNN